MTDVTTIANSRLRTAGEFIRYALIEGYPKLQLGDDGIAKATEAYVMAATDVPLFMQESVGIPYADFGSNRHVFPRPRAMPGSKSLVTKSVSAEPYNSDLPGDPFESDATAPAGTYSQLYQVTIEYETTPFSPGKDEEPEEPDNEEPFDFLDVTIDGSVEFLAIPSTGMKYKALPGDDPQVQQSWHAPITKLVPLIEVSANWKKITRPNWTPILATLGQVNEAQYRFSRGLYAPPETALFIGISGKQTYQWDPLDLQVIQKKWDLTFKFAVRRIHIPGVGGGADQVGGWNHNFNPTSGRWEIVTNANDEPVYSKTTFDDMFTPRPIGEE